MLKRKVEPELMDKKEQVTAYSAANFDEAHNLFIEEFHNLFQKINKEGIILDIGCGTADITKRLAKIYPLMKFHGIDGSKEMISKAGEMLEGEIKQRVQLIHANIASTKRLLQKYDAIVCNSTLHHLHNPQILWDFIERVSQNSTCFFYLKDLRRLESISSIKKILNKYTRPEEKEIFKKDFYNSLRAAFTVDEVLEQIKNREKLRNLKVKSKGDRHLVVYGVINNYEK